MGVMDDNFQSLGTTPKDRDWLKRYDRGSQIDSAQPFNILLEIPSGPEAVHDFSLLI